MTLLPAEAGHGSSLASLSPVRLSDLGLRREAPRPLHDRQPGYEALFDHDTLFYDVFRSGAEVICLGPPLLNCAQPWRTAVVPHAVLKHAFDRDLVAAFGIAFPERNPRAGR